MTNRNDVETVDFVEDNTSIVVRNDDKRPGPQPEVSTEAPALEGPGGRAPSPFEQPESRLVYDFSVLSEFESTVRTGLLALDGEKPGIGQDITKVFREHLQAAILANPSIGARDMNGLGATLNTLDDLRTSIRSQATVLDMQPEPVKQGYQRYLDIIYNEIELKEATLKRLRDAQNTPPTFKDLVLDAGSRLANRLMQKPVLTGQERTYYEREMRKKLTDLDGLTTKMRPNMGNPEWEQTEGIQQMKKMKSEFEKLRKLVAQTGEQLNGPEFGKRVDAIKEKLEALGEFAQTQAFKQALSDFIKEMAKSLQKMVNVIFKRGPSPA